MQLNLPIAERLAGCQRILIAGMGGGFDIYCGLPLAFALEEQGMQVHLANLSFSPLHLLETAERPHPALAGVTADTAPFASAGAAPASAGYFPEHYLARWFRERRGREVTVWAFERTGVRPLAEAYRRLVERLGIDALLLVDGGVDSLARGDEAEPGTYIEDAVSLAAAAELAELPTRLLACVGLGAEQDLTHAHIFENMAALAADGAFLGSCSLTSAMECYQAYEDATLYAQAIPGQDPSVINSSIISAAQGRYGNYHMTSKTSGSTLWISPLMPICWFFDLPGVVARNPMLAHAAGTSTFREAMRALSIAREAVVPRRLRRIPLQ
ncbi:DUF1152 domain-containing protein [Chloroflexia bacterium SDU3-3]|nr:DUF1152 domain-containing protein [Chloroflexia bacterium SDU3-3]